jgi:two-component system LytT family response regulator
MNAIIIDDEENARITLSLMIREHTPHITLVGCYSSLADAHSAIAENAIDVIFLDIQMPNESGFQLWKYFPNPTFHVVFTTAHQQYAIQAIRLSALDYLLKPIDIEELELVVQKLIQRKVASQIGDRLAVLEANLKNTPAISQIILPTQNSLIVIKIEDIVRCESDNNYTRFFLRDRTEHLISKTLKEYENILPIQTFLRIHQSHLINLKYVTRYMKGKNNFVEMADGVQLPVSKERKETLLAMLGKI